ncbi:MAG: DEAD/DEAH box helicase [Candidatus Woesearchaeota archaeon]
MSFEKLNVRPEIIRALSELEIVVPTQIQERAIPLIQKGLDVIGISKTGSGKTAAFGVPILERITPKQGVQALIVVPTRELACQIADELKKFSKYQPSRITTVYGGVSIQPQIQALRSAEVVCGTPGRLVDHLRQHTLNLSKIRWVVLDEADKMVDMGFIEDIRQIMDETPKQKQVMLFGATISDEVEGLKRAYMKEPQVARAEAHVKQEFLEQYYYNVEVSEKFSLLVHLLKKEQAKQAIVFCSKRSTVDILTTNLRAQGVRAEKIHGKLNQGTRLQVIDTFRSGRVNVLVASAVAARGLDFRNVTHIFNYDLSRDPQEYVHRVGRTARAGETGKAITLLSPNNHGEFSSILGQYNLNVQVLKSDRFPRLRFDTGRFDRPNSYHNGRNGWHRRAVRA